jgi:hypothetical protein
MAKIPVGATLAHACRFAFGDFLKILGTMWVALVVSWIPGFLMQPQMMATGIAAPPPGGLGIVLLLVYVAAFILLFMQILGIARLALGLRTGPYWVYFSLGKPLWRLIGSALLFVLAAVIGLVLALLASLLLGFLLGLVAKAANFPALTATIAFAKAIIAIAIWCGAFYCMVRLSFLLLPVVAAQEPGMALGRAWTLGRGNFWRMFLILAAIWTPLVLLEMVLLYFFFLKGLPFPSAGAPAQQSQLFQAAMNANAIRMIAGMRNYWYVVYPVFTVIAALFYGVAVGAQCFAYRAVTEGSAPVAGDGLPD